MDRLFGKKRDVRVSESTSRPLNHFPRYTSHHPRVPVWCATPDLSGVIHRFYDTSPISPSGRYLALTRIPYEDRLPSPGDSAQVILIDLDSGETQLLAETCAWDTQLGAQVQWGTEDEQLFYNDLDPQTWQPFGVKLDPFSGRKESLDGTVYMISPDGNWAISPSLLRTAMTQKGYGVTVPPAVIPRNEGASREDGIYRTNTATGECSLLVSIGEIVDSLGSHLEIEAGQQGDFYGFHVKWNPVGDRILFVLRWVPGRSGEERKNYLVTLKADGSDLQLAVPAGLWAMGGHHPNWCPDSEHILMNLNLDGQGLRFIKVRYDGTNLGIMSDSVSGSGHPSLHPNGRFILTDAYVEERVASGGVTSPIRWIDLKTGREEVLLRIGANPKYRGPKNELRLDPHPAWDRQFRRITFNGFESGTRKVFIADLSEILRR